MDNDGNIETTIETGENLLNMVVDGNQILTTSNSTIFDYDYSSGVLSSNNSNTNIISNRIVTVDNNWIYVSGNNSQSEIPIIEKYNKWTLELVEEISFGQVGKVTDLFSNNGELFITGQQEIILDLLIDAHTIKQSFVKSTPVFEAPAFKGTDISLSNINILQPAEVDFYDTLEYTYFYTHPYAIFEYDVTNNGNEPISSYAISTKRFTNFNCGEFRFYRYVDDVMILPGETKTIKDSIESSSATYSDELELTIFGPNHHFDGDNSDNSMIAEDPLLLPTAECGCIPGLQFSISPNPVSEQLNVFLQNENTLLEGEMQLVNLNGQVVDEAPVFSNQSHYLFPVRTLPNGMYFLQYQTLGQKVKTKKIMIHH